MDTCEMGTVGENGANASMKFSIVAVPGPWGMALLGFAGAWAVRRRRWAWA